MKVKIKCIKKNRDAKGNIKSYLLQKETGEVIEATGQQIKAEIAANNYEFINLQIDKAGRLVDKALNQDKEEFIESETLDETKRKKYLCKKKIIAETIRALEDDTVVLMEDNSVHATGRYYEEIEKVKKVWNSLGLEEKFEEVEIDRVEAAIFYYDHKKRLFFGVACGYFAGLESNYSYSEEKIRSSVSALVDEIASILSSNDDYEGWTKEELREEAKRYIDTNISNF
jgi:hypothetical protein